MPLLSLVETARATDGASASGGNSLLVGLVLLVLICAAAVAARRAPGLLLTALAGAGVAAYLAHDHRSAQSGGASLCNISEVWNCGLVNSSEWSELFGVPIALYGLGVYVALAWLAWRWVQGKAETSVLIVVIAAAAVAFDAFLGSQMVRMGAGCVVCLTTYALNLILLVGAALEARKHPFGSTLGGVVGAHGGVSVVLGLGAYLVGLMWYQGGSEPGSTATSAGGSTGIPVAELGQYYEAAGGTVTFDPVDPAYGDPAARFTLVEWADFQCPHCQWMYTQLHDLLADPANKDVRLIYRNYPISNTCNRFVGQDGHPHACAAAVAGECARDQGRFWELAGAMFKNQEYLGPTDIQFMVEQNGMDLKAFEACLAQPTTGQYILKDIEDGGKAGVQGTPSVYLLGAFGESWVRLKGNKEQISAILAAVREGKSLPPPGPPEPMGE